MDYKKLYEKSHNISANLSSLVGYWEGTAAILKYERDPKKIHEELNRVYELSKMWFELREQDYLTASEVEARFNELQEVGK